MVTLNVSLHFPMSRTRLLRFDDVTGDPILLSLKLEQLPSLSLKTLRSLDFNVFATQLLQNAPRLEYVFVFAEYHAEGNVAWRVRRSEDETAHASLERMDRDTDMISLRDGPFDDPRVI